SILGCTGSVGRSTLAVVDAFADRLRVVGLAAGSNVELLAEQIERYQPDLVSVRNEHAAAHLRARFPNIEVVPGLEGACAVAALPSAGAVLAAPVGAAAIAPVPAARRAARP